jgi:hypothetical protein
VTDSTIPTQTGGVDENALVGFVQEPAVSPAEGPKHADPQVHPVSSESAGYKAPGGLTRAEIRDRIGKARPYSSRTIDVPEWDISVEIRSMTLGDRNEMAMSMVNADGTSKPMGLFYPAILIACTYDAEGNKVFTDQDFGWIESLDAKTLDLIAEPALEMNGMKNAPKKVEEEAGKSGKTDDSVSPSK